MILETLSTARDLGRLHDIAVVLVRHGLGDAARRLGIASTLERAGKALHWKGAQGLDREPEVRVREALEELGPTFVKLGQVLAGRADLLPPSWTEELARLQDHAQPVPFDEVREQLREDLGGDPADAFQDFDPEPLAAASIAQVYRARLEDGTPVVLKARRPGIQETVEADLRLLKRVAEKAEQEIPELRRFRLRGLVRQFATSMRSELDLRIEAKNAARLRDNLAENPDIVVPRIHETWTSERLCVMDFLEGPSLGDWMRDGAPEEAERKRVAAVGAEAVLRAVFVDGCFHADPHAGNLLRLADGRVGLVDFGMIGTLTEARRLEFLDLLLAVTTSDADLAVSTLLNWSDQDVEMDLLLQDCTTLIDRYNGLPLEKLDATELLRDLTELVRENDLALPNDVALLLKVFVTLDGLGRRLDPGFVMAAHLEPFVRRAWARENSPAAIARRGLKGLHTVLHTLPQDLKRLALHARRGRLHLDLDVDGLEELARRLDRSVSRLTVGLVTAALIVGTSIALTVSGGPRLLGLPVFGLLGFGSSLLGGVWLLWSIVRSSRPPRR